MEKKGEIAQMSNFTFFHNVFYEIGILNSFNNHISVVVCSFFEFGTVSKWCIREWVDILFHINWVNLPSSGSSCGSLQDLRVEGLWFEPRLGQLASKK